MLLAANQNQRTQIINSILYFKNDNDNDKALFVKENYNYLL